MSTQNDRSTRNQTAEKSLLNKRLEAIGWVLFLTMIAGLWLMPGERVPESTWLIGVGLIMLGLNGARYFNGVKRSGFTIVLGILALFFRMSGVLGVDLPFFPILLLLIGAKIILEPLIKKRRG